jgi:hypothetical protein
MSERLPITDSPWYWVLLFSVVSLGAIAAIQVKYGRRQANLERQYQARERVQDDATADPTRREYSTPDATLIPLWPLAVLLGGVAMLAAGMLARGRVGRGRGRPGSLRDEGRPP